MKLKISVNEIHEIIRVMPNYPENPRLIYQMKKVKSEKFGNHFKISDRGEDEEIIFNQDSLLNLLHSPLGLCHLVETTDLNPESKFDVELIKTDEYWEIDN